MGVIKKRYKNVNYGKMRPKKRTRLITSTVPILGKNVTK